MLWSTQMSERHQPDAISIEKFVHFVHYIRFVSCDPAKNRNRFYLLSWQPTLDGRAVLISTWGRLGTPGRARVMCYREQADVQDIIAQIIRRRLQRGYRVVEWR